MINKLKEGQEVEAVVVIQERNDITWDGKAVKLMNRGKNI